MARMYSPIVVTQSSLPLLSRRLTLPENEPIDTLPISSTATDTMSSESTYTQSSLPSLSSFLTLLSEPAANTLPATSTATAVHTRFWENPVYSQTRLPVCLSILRTRASLDTTTISGSESTAVGVLLGVTETDGGGVLLGVTLIVGVGVGVI